MAIFQHAGRPLPEVPLLSQMTQGVVHLGNDDPGNDNGVPDFPALEPALEVDKRRPWSSQGIKTPLSPSPTLIEARRHSKDDNEIDTSPSTPQKPSLGARLSQNLSLQMPPRDVSSTSTANLSKRIPVSPKPDSPTVFTSPTSVLPRRSRGMDYSRAATNLHHSTLADQPSPESSPTVGGRRGIMIPPRKPPSNGATVSTNPESPSLGAQSLWTAFPTFERSCLSSSLPNSIGMDDDSADSSSDEDDMMDYGEDEDTIHMTPQANGVGLVNPFGPVSSSPGGESVGGFPATAAKLLSYQRHRVHSRRNRARNSSGSASGHSAMQSPGPNSPPMLRPTDINFSVNGVFMLDEPAKRDIVSRRESLSLGTNDLQLSDAEQSDDGGPLHSSYHDEPQILNPATPSMEERKEVVRRAVTRRGNLLPKSKNFARIRAELLEEGAPIDSDVKREAEVIRQVRESDADQGINLQPSQPTTSASSPSIGPITATVVDGAVSIPDESPLESEESSRQNSYTRFQSQAIRNSGGVTFWNSFDDRMRTPPPPVLIPRGSSSGVSDEMSVENSHSSMTPTTPHLHGVRSEETLVSNSQTTVVPRKGKKRMRDDDFDANYFKRRAVSPGLSVQNSPVLPQSPGWWGTQPRNNVSVNGERSASNGSSASMGAGCAPKRVGLQGMNDTNDGLMNMSIE